MRLKIIGYILAGSVVGTGAFAADSPGNGASGLSLTELCAHARLSAADQAECRAQASAATTEIQRLEVRRTFEAKAGLRAGSMSGAGSTSGTTSPENSGILDEGRAGRTGGTSVGDPITAPAAKPKVD